MLRTKKFLSIKNSTLYRFLKKINLNHDKRNIIYFSAFSSARKINTIDIKKFKSYITKETLIDSLKVELINFQIIENNSQPDWAFPKLNNYNFNSFYYYKYKLIL